MSLRILDPKIIEIVAVKDAEIERLRAELASAKEDAECFRYFVSDPETGRHLLLLLSQGKGDAAALRRMIGRIQESKANALDEARKGESKG